MAVEPSPTPVGAERHRRPRRRRARALTVLVAVLVLGGLAVVGVEMADGPTAGHRAGAQPVLAVRGVPTPTKPAPRSATPEKTAGVSVIGRSGATLLIPALGVRAPLVPTGATGAPGTASLTVPADVSTVAWWDGTVRDGDRTVHEAAPSPGQPGVALLAGHVDSATAGPGALYDLKDLVAGDTLEIVDSDHQASTWTVSGPPDTALKTQLPPALWVTTGRPRLALVTCGGPFDEATGHYRDNVIVWAVPSDRR